MGVLEFLVPFYPINTARVVFSSDSKMDPLNLYPTIGPNLDHWKLFVNLSSVGMRELIVNFFYLVAIGKH